MGPLEDAPSGSPSYHMCRAQKFSGGWKGKELLLKTNDNKVYLAEVEKQKDGAGFKSEKNSERVKHNVVDKQNEASPHNYETEGANGDYTDSYEEEDADQAKAKGNKSEKIKMENEDDEEDDLIWTPRLLEKIKAARKILKKKKGNDYSLVGGEDISEDILKKEKPLWRTTQCASILQTQYSFSDEEKEAQGVFRSSDEPKKYGEGSQVLKACKPASLVEYQLARKGGNAEVKEAIKRVQKEGLHTDVKKEKIGCDVLLENPKEVKDNAAAAKK